MSSLCLCQEQASNIFYISPKKKLVWYQVSWEAKLCDLFNQFYRLGKVSSGNSLVSENQCGGAPFCSKIIHGCFFFKFVISEYDLWNHKNIALFLVFQPFSQCWQLLKLSLSWQHKQFKTGLPTCIKSHKISCFKIWSMHIYSGCFY